MTKTCLTAPYELSNTAVVDVTSFQATLNDVDKFGREVLEEVEWSNSHKCGSLSMSRNNVAPNVLKKQLGSAIKSEK